MEIRNNIFSPAQGSQTAVLSVSELSINLKHLIEGFFENVQVKGEISGAKLHSSGHLYFAIKDENALLDAVCWRGCLNRLSFIPQDGMEVICRGRITTYPGRSKYQIIAEYIELAGEGALLKLLEDRKRKLASEGLFDVSRKKMLPFLPRSIGIITSPTGAVIQDMLHRLQDRFPCDVLLWPVLVQGDGAADQISQAIYGFNELPSDLRPDLLIVARGGGSLEDLWAFNEEIVVRAAANSQIPLISGVGHEPDVTLIDLAADYRAPTPTAAAERAVPVRQQIQSSLEQTAQRLERLLLRILMAHTLKFDESSERLQNSLPRCFERWDNFVLTLRQRLRHPQDLISNYQSYTQGLAKQLDHFVMRLIDHSSHRLERDSSLLRSYSFQATLQRGFILLRTESGHLITSVNECQPHSKVQMILNDGNASAVII